ncbi:PREDICTED: ras-related and estrogen-regulated growth inhibitor-like, partial [Nicrophorus vespilloides]|uniref:small monomeric GTPase n=1 Tax=Nicrophorus vespilloides TaxID=110193 RepID=A0ABM1N4F0_NICVS
MLSVAAGSGSPLSGSLRNNALSLWITVTVRYLTKRYIGEYSSTSDFLYRHNVTFDNVTTEVEILDTSKCA